MLLRESVKFSGKTGYGCSMLPRVPNKAHGSTHPHGSHRRAPPTPEKMHAHEQAVRAEMRQVRDEGAYVVRRPLACTGKGKKSRWASRPPGFRVSWSEAIKKIILRAARLQEDYTFDEHRVDLALKGRLDPRRAGEHRLTDRHQSVARHHGDGRIARLPRRRSSDVLLGAV